MNYFQNRGFNNYGYPNYGYIPQQPSYNPGVYNQAPQQMQQGITPSSIPSTNELPIQGVPFVTEDEAKAYIVLPNTKLLLMDKNNSVFYIKSADSLGKSSFEAFEFRKREEKPKEEPVTGQLDLSDFVKKNDLKNFVTNDTIKQLEEKMGARFEEIKKSINVKKLVGDIDNDK